MNTRINLLISALFVTIILLGSACKKESDNQGEERNTAVIKLNGAQPAIDSVIAVISSSNGSVTNMNVWVYIQSSPESNCEFRLLFSPSDPLYAEGAIINLATSTAARINYTGSNKTYGDPYKQIEPPGHYVGGNGTITITKNDIKNRRIECSIANCVLTNPGNTNDKVTLEGNFAVTYPAP